MFGGGRNPFTEIVDRATAETNVSENWELNMQICDLILTRPDGFKDAAKAIKKRVTTSKSTKISLLTLSLLETCVNNCGQRFYMIVVVKDLPEYVKLIKTKNLDESVRNKLLDLIQIWATGLSADPLSASVKEEYKKLQTAGYSFPARNLDELTPISSTPTTDLAPLPPAQPGVVAYGQPRPYVYAAQPAMLGGQPGVVFQQGQVVPLPPGTYLQQGPNGWAPTPVTQNQYPRTFVNSAQPVQRIPLQTSPQSGLSLSQELAVFRETINLFAETLAFTDPTMENVSDNQLIQELESQLRGMRARIGLLLSSATEEALIAQLCQTSDDINNQLEAYQICSAKFASRNDVDATPGFADLRDRAPTLNTNHIVSIRSGQQQANLISFDDDDEDDEEDEEDDPTLGMSYQQVREIESILGHEDPAVIADLAGLEIQRSNSGARVPQPPTHAPRPESVFASNNPFLTPTLTPTTLIPVSQPSPSPSHAVLDQGEPATTTPPSQDAAVQKPKEDVDFF